MIWIIVFAPTYAAAALLKHKLIPVSSWYEWILGAILLAAGLWVCRRYYPGRVLSLGMKGWPWALAALVAFVGAWYSVVIPHLPHGVPVGLIGLEYVKFVVFIGFVEELWYRGIWFAMFGGRLAPCVVLGSIVFGALHLIGDVGSAILSLGIGAVFAAARYGGAPVILLGIVHGTLDWLIHCMLPISGVRLQNTATFLIVPTATWIIVASIMVLYARLAGCKKAGIRAGLGGAEMRAGRSYEVRP
jgi:hypothetical protein